MKQNKSKALTPKQSQIMKVAVALHQAGQLNEAELQYRKLLVVMPTNTALLSNLGTIAFQNGDLDTAVKLFDRSLLINPNQANTLYNCGVALKDLKKLDDALVSFDRAIALVPDYVDAYFIRSVTLYELTRLNDALISFDEVIALKPDYADAQFNRGVVLHELNRLDEALDAYKHTITLKPDYFAVYFKCGLILQEFNRWDEALAYYDCAIALNPDYADAYSNRGNTLHALNRSELALESFDRAIVLKPNYIELYSNRGVALHDLNRLDEALASYDHLIAFNSDYADVHTNRGNTLYALKRLDEALVSYDVAITLKQESEVNYTNRGNVLQELKRFDEALVSYERAISINPNHADAYLNLGNALQELKLLNEAVAYYDQAIVLNAHFASTHFNRGVALRALKRLDEALLSFECALAINPNMDFILGYVLHTKMHLCLWDDLQNLLTQLTYKINNGQKVINPFPLLSLLDDPNIQRKAAETYVNEYFPLSYALPKISSYPKHSKIKIGYFSADFNNHPVAILTAELYETHDRSLFEIYAFSYGPDTNDALNVRIKAGVDHFYDVHNLLDKDVVLLARNLEIDIAVDLGGFTVNSRTGIFAMQAAPIQVNYLGYPGTLMAEYFDYIIADATVIPENNQLYYSERVAYLPNSFMVSDTKQKLSNRVFTRDEVGLPINGFVFCCFNSFYKITPDVFATWMRILFQVEGSVLWLPEGNLAAVNNLKEEAYKNNIDANRLIFAPRLPSMEDHLNRLLLADLFIDTLPYNAHTTTSDALKMGLPVLTCMGESFASRVAASLLNAVNLPELITTNPADYEALALDLAIHPVKLTAIKTKLLANLSTAPLYNTSLFVQHLESAYKTMVQRKHDGLAPDHIVVDTLGSLQHRPEVKMDVKGLHKETLLNNRGQTTI